MWFAFLDLKPAVNVCGPLSKQIHILFFAMLKVKHVRGSSNQTKPCEKVEWKSDKLLPGQS